MAFSRRSSHTRAWSFLRIVLVNGWRWRTGPYFVIIWSGEWLVLVKRYVWSRSLRQVALSSLQWLILFESRLSMLRELRSSRETVIDEDPCKRGYLIIVLVYATLLRGKVNLLILWLWLHSWRNMWFGGSLISWLSPYARYVLLCIHHIHEAQFQFLILLQQGRSWLIVFVRPFNSVVLWMRVHHLIRDLALAAWRMACWRMSSLSPQTINWRTIVSNLLEQ